MNRFPACIILSVAFLSEFVVTSASTQSGPEEALVLRRSIETARLIAQKQNRAIFFGRFWKENGPPDISRSQHDFIALVRGFGSWQ
jgi:hypothetical protein